MWGGRHHGGRGYEEPGEGGEKWGEKERRRIKRGGGYHVAKGGGGRNERKRETRLREKRRKMRWFMSEEESEMTCRRRRRRVCLQEEEKQGVVERGDGLRAGRRWWARCGWVSGWVTRAPGYSGEAWQVFWGVVDR